MSHPVVEKKRKKKKNSSDDDTDFQADSSSEYDDDIPEAPGEAELEAFSLNTSEAQRHNTSGTHVSPNTQNRAGAFMSQSAPNGGGAHVSMYMQKRKDVFKSPEKKIHKGVSTPSNRFPSKFVAIPPSKGANVGSVSGPSNNHIRATHDNPCHKSTTQILDLTSESSKANEYKAKPFERVNIPIRSPLGLQFGQQSLPACPACQKQHIRGACELKVSGVEYCGLCGLAHFGHARTCPHIKSETQVREMLEALRSSPEKKELVDLATKYLRGVKGTLVQQKKRNREKLQGMPQSSSPPSGYPSSIHEHSYAYPGGPSGTNAVRTSYDRSRHPGVVPNPSYFGGGHMGNMFTQRIFGLRSWLVSSLWGHGLENKRRMD